jgi:cyclase
MLKKRIIPCLDIKDGRTVKGVNFVDIIDAGDPVVLARRYVEEGADELVFLDIGATIEGRKTLIDLVRRIAAEINIPFTVGGGITTIDDVRDLIRAGADKVSINSAAVRRPSLIRDIAQTFGSQCVVVAIDTDLVDDDWMVYVRGGRVATDLHTVEWTKEVARLGAGEILLTSMRQDGTRGGFAIDITGQVADAVNIPVIASGGAGRSEDFTDLFSSTAASAALAASIFHFGDIAIPDLKQFINQQSIPVRL